MKIRKSENLRFFFCPACECAHAIDPTRWSWNGDVDTPTISPSILVKGTVPVTDEEAALILKGEPFTPARTICHSYVKNGNIEFLSDCTHAFAGKTVPLEDF